MTRLDRKMIVTLNTGTNMMLGVHRNDIVINKIKIFLQA